VTDRVPSDHSSVSTFRTRLARSGGTHRPCLRVPDETPLSGDTVVRLVLDGRAAHAPVDEDARGRLVRGAYDNRRMARERAGTNRLVEWTRENDCDPGDAVELDEVTPGHLYGLRVPGTRTVYEPTGPPDDSLSAIADRLADDRRDG
jgi:hypothetical protein